MITAFVPKPTEGLNKELSCITLASEDSVAGRKCVLCDGTFPITNSSMGTEFVCPECKEVWAKLKQWVLNWEDNE